MSAARVEVDFPSRTRDQTTYKVTSGQLELQVHVDGLPFTRLAEDFERVFLHMTMMLADYNLSEAARLSGMHRRTLQRQLTKAGLRHLVRR